MANALPGSGAQLTAAAAAASLHMHIYHSPCLSGPCRRLLAVLKTEDSITSAFHLATTSVISEQPAAAGAAAPLHTHTMTNPPNGCEIRREGRR